MSPIHASLISILFLAGCLFVAVSHFGWALGIVIIMFYISNMFDRQVVIMTSLLKLIQVEVTDHIDDGESNGTN